MYSVSDLKANAGINVYGNKSGYELRKYLQLSSKAVGEGTMSANEFCVVLPAVVKSGRAAVELRAELSVPHPGRKLPRREMLNDIGMISFITALSRATNLSKRACGELQS